MQDIKIEVALASVSAQNQFVTWYQTFPKRSQRSLSLSSCVRLPAQSCDRRVYAGLFKTIIKAKNWPILKLFAKPITATGVCTEPENEAYFESSPYKKPR